MDLCLMCKACKAECPSNVDVAKLKAEYLNAYYRHRPRPLGHRLMANIHRLNRTGAPAGDLINWFSQKPWARWLLEKIAGIDRRRSLPPLHKNHFRAWFARHRPDANAGRVGQVILWTIALRPTTSRKSAGRRCGCWSAPATGSHSPASNVAAGRS